MYNHYDPRLMQQSADIRDILRPPVDSPSPSVTSCTTPKGCAGGMEWDLACGDLPGLNVFRILLYKYTPSDILTFYISPVYGVTPSHPTLSILATTTNPNIV